MLAELLWTSEVLLALATKVGKIAIIIVVTGLAIRFFRLLVNQMVIPKVGERTIFDEKRGRTLNILIQSIISYALYFIAIVMSLQVFQIDTTSIIAGAGIITLALGVGAQSLIKDFITGFFIILENQYAVGDYIIIAELTGTVEEVGFRATKLRDANGILHFIPHGTITKVSNYTRGHMQAVINVPVAYEANIAKVLALLEEACTDIAEQMPEVLEGPKVLGVVDLRPGEIIIRLIANTVPLENAKVEIAIRQKIKMLFDAAHIPAPNAYLAKGLGES